jgi:hypothetical protein
LENETLDVREDVGQNMSFNLGMGHDSIIELAEEEFILLVLKFSQRYIFWDMTQCSPVKAHPRFGGK